MVHSIGWFQDGIGLRNSRMHETGDGPSTILTIFVVHQDGIPSTRVDLLILLDFFIAMIL